MDSYFKYCLFAVICTLWWSPAALAQDEEEEGPWSGRAALGYLATSGNTENSSLNTNLEVGYKTGDWQHGFGASAIHASENNVTTADAFELKWKSERSFTEHDFLFGRVNWREDKFSGYDRQLSETIGYGRRIIDGTKHKLNAEIGVGARQSDLSDGTAQEEFIVRGGLKYAWIFSESAEFTQEFVVESGAENTYTESVSALKAKLIGSLALVASFTVKNNSDVPVATEKTDTFSALSLDYTF